MSAVIYSFLSLVFVLSYKMDPAKVGIAMMLPRLVDIVVDPVLGRFSDILHTPWGRRRPFMFVTTILGAILVMAVWWMPVEWAADWKGFTYLVCFTTVLYANLGAFQMAHGALGYELSDDYQLRSKVQALNSFYMGLGSLGGGYIYWIAQQPFFGEGQAGEVHGFRCLSIIMAIFVLVFGLIPTFACRERFQNINRTHVNVWKALKATLSNKPFIVILILKFINVLGTSLFGALSAYVCIYCVCNGDKALYNKIMGGWTGIAGFILGWIMVLVAAPITRWLGKQRGLILCYGLMAVYACILPFFARPGNIYIWFGITILFFLPANIILVNLMASVMPDICDLDELAHGERREGLFTAVISFMTKLESSVCIGLGGGLLALAGFNQHLAAQPLEVLDKMRFYAFTPMITGAILTFIVAWFFPLNKKKMDEVRTQLDIRHASR
jgi:GPH family glycoside/pentoside/hexuronide:cation symporter